VKLLAGTFWAARGTKSAAVTVLVKVPPPAGQAGVPAGPFPKLLQRNRKTITSRLRESSGVLHLMGLHLLDGWTAGYVPVLQKYLNAVPE
jgi:hypothetical protein